MYPTMIIKQFLDVNKKVIEDSISAMIAFQEHTEKMLRVFWERSGLFPIESKKALDDWAKNYKGGLNDYKSNVDEHFKLMEQCLVNASPQVESPMQAVLERSVPVSHVDEVTTRKAAGRAKKEDAPVIKTVKPKAKLDKIK